MAMSDLPTDRPFTRAEALDCGVGDGELLVLIGAARVVRMMRGVYRLAECPDTLMTRCAALGLQVPGGSFICDRTAAWLYVGDKALAPNEDLVVPAVSCFRTRGRTRLRGPLTHSGQRTVTPVDLTEIGGLVVTTPLRTALDLGRLSSTFDLRLWGMDVMLGLGVFEHEDLLEQIERFKGDRGVVGLRTLAPYADGGSDSFGESSVRLRWLNAGLPRPMTQVPEQGPYGAVALDMGLPEERFGAEFDGEKHHGPAQERHDTERRDHVREVRGWVLPVFRRVHVWGPAQNADVVLRRAWLEHRRRRR